MIDYDKLRELSQLLDVMTCDECGAVFEVEHEMGIQYIPQYCVFCGEAIPLGEERIDYDQEPTLN